MGRRGRVYGLLLICAIGVSPFALVAPAGAASRPSAPGRPAAFAGNAAARVTWKAPASNGSAIRGYVVTPYVGKVAQPSKAFNSTVRTQVITGLKNGKTYTFKVAARNGVGLGPRSAASNAVTPTTKPTLAVANNATIGKPIIVDSHGMTLYLYVPDGNSKISKVPAGGVKAAWPAVAWANKPIVGAGLDQHKIALNIQPDGTPQVAYNGHLLYAFVNDTKPGDATGQGVNNFYVVSPAGNKIP
jgi:predicted lipoprotein with Yx(FWY)xxD motif